MRAILIDPFAKEITEVDYDGDYKKIYDLIDCKTFDVVNVPSGNDGIYIDDEGLYAPKQAWFTYRFNAHPMHQNIPLVNKALVIGLMKRVTRQKRQILSMLSKAESLGEW